MTFQSMRVVGLNAMLNGTPTHRRIKSLLNFKDKRNMDLNR